MSEQVFVVEAGTTPVIEVVKSEDGLSLTIRVASNHDRSVTMPSSAVYALISALRRFTNTPQPGPTTTL